VLYEKELKKAFRGDNV